MNNCATISNQDSKFKSLVMNWKFFLIWILCLLIPIAFAIGTGWVGAYLFSKTDSDQLWENPWNSAALVFGFLGWLTAILLCIDQVKPLVKRLLELCEIQRK